MRPCINVLALALLAAGTGDAFELPVPPTRWASSTFTMQVNITHPTHGANSPSGTSWNDAFQEAGEKWNVDSAGRVELVANLGSFEDPCDDEDGVNGVDFGSDVCGTAFGGATLAIARRRFGGGGLVDEGNIVFNSSSNLDVFSGPFVSSARDFRRVAVHEIGHLWGLDHAEGVSAIMESITSSIEDPQADDLDGIDFVYDLVCPTLELGREGTTLGTLAFRDCTDTEAGTPLPALGGVTAEVDSLVDLYRVTLDEATTLMVALTAPTGSGFFNPTIQILDQSLSNELGAVFNTANTTANLSRQLAAGSYVVVVRTLFSGAGGDYTLSMVPEPSGGGAVTCATLVALWLRRRGLRERVRRDAGSMPLAILAHDHASCTDDATGSAWRSARPAVAYDGWPRMR